MNAPPIRESGRLSLPQAGRYGQFIVLQELGLAPGGQVGLVSIAAN